VTLPRRSLAPLVFAIALLAACQEGGGPTGAPQPTGLPAHNATEVSGLPTTVDALPDVDPAGYQQLLGELRGTPTLVNVWASWCTPCRTEIPRLVAAHQQYGTTVQFLGIDLLDNRSGAQAFIRDLGMSYPSLFDPSGAVRDSLGLFAPPVTLFYDSRGRLVATSYGEISETDLQANLRAIDG
jgi:cytochrome c biogenesis protein CcmG, thiol:disulfide interchange protein DsbE